MGALSDLQPERVFYYFEELTKIPHGSGNVDAISDYLAEFGRSHGLFVQQDAWKNVIIIKEASSGYEDREPLILQGHMDMVAVCDPAGSIDMKTEPLKAAHDDEYVFAKNTSLGGDDGIAVAYALALLEDETLRHPRLEVVITTDEEVGMDGAREIDLSCLKGHLLLNIDSEEEGIFTTGCAGGARVSCQLSAAAETLTSTEEKLGKLAAFDIHFSGLQGGHSGEEINKERANANLLAARLLLRLSHVFSDLVLLGMQGGTADNAIPDASHLSVAICEKDSDSFIAFLSSFCDEIKAELSTKDPSFTMTWNTNAMRPAYGLQKPIHFANFLNALPNGIQAMSLDVPGLVETSLNLGQLSCVVNDTLSFPAMQLSATFSVRSSIATAKTALIDRLRAVTELAGGEISVSGDYPGWQFRVDSPLRDRMISLYEKMYGRQPIVKAIHAGLECGLLGSKLQDLDAVSIGPDMKDIHTPKERLNIASTARVYEYIRRLIEE